MGGAPDKASDLYSFGVMLFEMACGRLPFLLSESDERVEALLRAHTTEVAPSPEEVGAEVPPELSLLLEELLSKSPADRPANALAVKERLQSVRQPPVPLVTFRASGSTRFTRSARLRAAGVGLVALGLSLVVVRSSLGRAAPITLAAPVVAAPAPNPPEKPEPTPEQPPTLAVAEPLQVEAAPAPVRVTPSSSPQVQRRLCQPDERWRAAAQVNLQELQQLAARKGHWAEFERLEPALSSAVSDARTAEQCEAADRQIRRLATGWRK